ncbi:hypothetical protein ACA758_01495 [Mycoplasmopsis agassizii]|uniref:Nucleoside phosphorylase domain-containing protein n=1 Tax=Mycoplasmopsis agassizii TaxID=33922 RepID=A0A1W1X7M3_9BACT|nr:hypothetical protein [Mycoplasmopsis agassizii]PAF55099.1 hypothetical protein CJF60_00205 [Mycoplasmopsis agassizii]PAK21442.1 hypothetical protein CJJ23_02230 [Mycoplasmopsis agassizii]SMC19935.1 adenosylhomocysteine nucleosidase [Mycoplasmopsis agassizii]
MAKKRIHLIVADKNEVDIIVNSGFKNTKTVDTNLRKYYLLENKDLEIILGWSKIGLVNAAITMQDMINTFKPKIIYNFGAVGSLNKDDLFKTFIISDAYYSDVDTPWYLPGQLPGEPQSFKLFTNFKNVAKMDKRKIASANSFIYEYEKAFYIKNVLTTDLYDMETAALAHTAIQNKIAFSSFKSVSDIVDLSGNKDIAEINRNIQIAGDNAFKLLIKSAI